MIIEALILASALSADAFVASFAYGSNKIKIPAVSVHIINIICSVILGISLLIGTMVRAYIPGFLTTAICFTILFLLGLAKLFDSITKSIIRKNSNLNGQFKFSMFNFKFVLSLYADPQAADIDRSKTISPSEAAALAVALSLDGLAVGFGAALVDINGWAVFICSLITGFIALISGAYLGNRIAHRLRFNISWISGIVLIILAFMKFIS